jgi:hypothetical protein
MTRTITAIRAGVMLPALTLLAACSNHDPATAGGDRTFPSPSASDVGQPLDTTTTDIRILIEGRPMRAQLTDNPTARALADRLPLTLSFRDLNGVEKIARLAEPLTTDGVPDGADPDIADIGYYAPTQDLVLYYGDVGYWNGIVRIGRYDDSQLSDVRDQPDGLRVTFERA